MKFQRIFEPIEYPKADEDFHKGSRRKIDERVCDEIEETEALNVHQ